MIKNKTLRQLIGALETFNLLSLRLALKNPAKVRMFPGRIFRAYMGLVRQDRWRSREIFEVIDLPPGTRIALEHIPGRGIATPLDELAYLALITKACRPSNIFEIGTFRGRTALNFAMNAPDDCTVWTLDLPPAERAPFANVTNPADRAIIHASKTGVDYQDKPEARKIHQLYGNSISFDFSPYAGQMDLVFIDGAHHYEAVISDTRNALNLVKPGGTILWHDFANYGDYHDVTRAVLDLLPGDQIIQLADSQLALYRHPATTTHDQGNRG
jgi:predicted O-methyltransferase YrrM